jgi:hypothetical protein
MCQITHAVLLSDNHGAPPRIAHLYFDATHAYACATAYVSTLGVPAYVAEFSPPLPQDRGTDSWAAFDAGERRLYMYGSAVAAAAAAAATRRLALPAQVRRTTPANMGVPQFLPAFCESSRRWCGGHRRAKLNAPTCPLSCADGRLQRV